MQRFVREAQALVRSLFSNTDPDPDHRYNVPERQQLYEITTEQPRRALPYTMLVQRVNAAMDDYNIPISQQAVHAIEHNIDIRLNEAVDPLQRDINTVSAEHQVARAFAHDGSSLGEFAHRALAVSQHTALSVGNGFNNVDEEVASSLFRRTR